jgi:hypothetical protein
MPACQYRVVGWELRCGDDGSEKSKSVASHPIHLYFSLPVKPGRSFFLPAAIFTSASAILLRSG